MRPMETRYDRLFDMYNQYNSHIKDDKERQAIAQIQLDNFMRSLVQKMEDCELQPVDVNEYVENHIRIYEGLIQVGGQPVVENKQKTRYWR
jgi:hypothetical protein